MANVRGMTDAWVVMCVGGEELPLLPDGKHDYVAIAKRAAELRSAMPPILTVDEALAREAKRE